MKKGVGLPPLEIKTSQILLIREELLIHQKRNKLRKKEQILQQCNIKVFNQKKLHN